MLREADAERDDERIKDPGPADLGIWVSAMIPDKGTARDSWLARRCFKPSPRADASRYSTVILVDPASPLMWGNLYRLKIV